MKLFRKAAVVAAAAVLATAAGASAAGSTRQQPSSPWTAGAYYKPTSGSGCSLSFGGSVKGKAYMLTARHCQPKENQSLGTVGGALVGYTRMSDEQLDVTFVEVDKASGYAYTGPWNSSGGDRVLVYGWGTSKVGDAVCTSGGSSGEHCNLKVTGNDGPFIVAEATDGKVAVAAGDSGGPVYTPKDSTGVQARGVITKGSGKVDCKLSGTVDPDAKDCYSKVLFAPMQEVVSRHGFSVR